MHLRSAAYERPAAARDGDGRVEQLLEQRGPRPSAACATAAQYQTLRKLAADAGRRRRGRSSASAARGDRRPRGPRGNRPPARASSSTCRRPRSRPRSAGAGRAASSWPGECGRLSCWHSMPVRDDPARAPRYLRYLCERAAERDRLRRVVVSCVSASAALRARNPFAPRGQRLATARGGFARASPACQRAFIGLGVELGGLAREAPFVSPPPREGARRRRRGLVRRLQHRPPAGGGGAAAGSRRAILLGLLFSRGGGRRVELCARRYIDDIFRLRHLAASRRAGGCPVHKAPNLCRGAAALSAPG